jgi:hypothetical protein
MIRVAFLSFVAVALTGCGVSEQDSKKLWSSIEASLGHSAGGTKQQALSVGINFDVDCANGGTASLDASLDVGGTDTGAARDGAVGVDPNPTPGVNTLNALFGYDVAYDRCQPDDNTLNGDLKYEAELVATSTDAAAGVDVQTLYRGSVTSSGATNGTCDVDVTGQIQAAAGEGPGDEFQSGVHIVYSGTICGHDASQVLNVDEKVSGSAQP